ncbi:heparinase II/III family protein [Arthrobacter sp. ISL-48]|nr:heparinase II/III family protein [Arthrobacter sp. ISL-48]
MSAAQVNLASRESIRSPRGAFRGPLAAAWRGGTGKGALLLTLKGSRERLKVHLAAAQGGWPAAGAATLASLERGAEAERGTPWPQPLVSHYARYFRDGNRTAYEGLVASRQQRLTRAVVMACLSRRRNPGVSELREEWLDEVIDGAYLLCEQSSWCWAAHEDTFARRGDVVPDRSAPYLDLGAGEVAAQLAWLDLVLGRQLDRRAPGLRRRIRDEVLERVVRPFLERDDWHWLGLDGDVHNWNPWIHSNVIAAAVVLVDDPELQAETVALAIEGLDRFFASLPADGAIDEGFAYWWNGAGRALEAFALLEEATAGTLDGDIPVVRELVAFPHRMHLGHRWYLNVADGPALAWTGLPWDLVRRWGERLGDRDAVRHATAFQSAEPTVESGLGRTLHALLDRPPSQDPHNEVQVTPPLAGFSYLESVQIMLARENPGSTVGLVLAAKGGHNGEHHNHRDVGSVVVAVDGVPLLADAGQPTYTAQTFGPGRYGIRAMQSSWHSVPAPFGLEQGTGPEFAAAVQHVPTSEDPRLVLALGGAYGLGSAASWTRSASLEKAAVPAAGVAPGTSRVLIEDRWNLPSPGAEAGTAEVEGRTPDVDIHYVLSGTVDLSEEGTATVRPEGIPDAAGGRGALLGWDPAAAVVHVDEWLLDDPLLSEVWGRKLTRLRFRMPQTMRSAGAFTLTVEATDES